MMKLLLYAVDFSLLEIDAIKAEIERQGDNWFSPRFSN
jgi:hypothetical protein